MDRSTAFCEKITDALEQNRNEENRQAMEAYMKNHFPFFGIKAPERRKITAPIMKEYSDVSEEERHQAARLLFRKEERECHHAALSFLEKGTKNAPEEAIDVYKELLMRKSWWDTVDTIASKLCGRYFLRYPDKLHSYTVNWRASENMWVRRSSVLHQLSYK